MWDSFNYYRTFSCYCGVVIAAVGIGTPASLATGMILVMVGSLLLGLGLARARSRRVEVERHLEVVSMQIEGLKEEYKALLRFTK